MHQPSSMFPQLFITRHVCGVTRLLSIIVYLYCKSSKPYSVMRLESFIILPFHHLSLPNKTVSKLAMDYHQLFLNLFRNCTGNSHLTL